MDLRSACITRVGACYISLSAAADRGDLEVNKYFLALVVESLRQAFYLP